MRERRPWPFALIVVAPLPAALAGAVVNVQGTQLGASTDADGLFVNPDAPAGDVVLQAAAPDHAAAVVTLAASEPAAKIALQSTVTPVAPPPTPTTRSIHGKVT